MGRFRDMARGTLSRHTVELTMMSGEVAKVAVRPLLDDEWDVIDERAREHAEKHGVQNPQAGDTIYERAYDRYRLLLACSDPDSPDTAPVPFFESEEEIRLGLDRDRIAFLVAAQELWQDRCSPRQLRMSGDEYVAMVAEVAASEDSLPFVRMRPGLQWSFMRTMAAECVSLRRLKLPSTLSSETNTSNSGQTLTS